MNITTNNVELPENNGPEEVKPYIKPGVHEVKVAFMESFESSVKKTPGIKIIFEGKPMEELNGRGQTAEESLWFSAGAQPYSLVKLAEIATAIGVKEQLDAVNAESTSEYVKQALPILMGKYFRCKFSGEEVSGGEGKNNWVKSKLPFNNFAESLEVSTEDSRLSFDRNRDITFLPTVEDMAGAEGTTSDDLPF